MVNHKEDQQIYNPLENSSEMNVRSANAVDRWREQSLKKIVTVLFQKNEYHVVEEPSLFEKTPDLEVSKANQKFYIELKAYHKSSWVTEAELIQCLCYFYYACLESLGKNPTNYDPDEILETQGIWRFKPIVILFSTGTIVNFQDLADIDFERMADRMKQRVSSAKQICYRSHRQDDFNTYYRLRGWEKKFRKYDISTIPDHIVQVNSIEEFEKIPENSGLYIISPDFCVQLLKTANLPNEANLFNKVRDLPMETLLQMKVFPK